MGDMRRGADTSPRFDQRGGSGGKSVGPVQQITASFSRPDPFIQNAVLRHASRHAVSVGTTAPADKDIALNQTAATFVKFVRYVLSFSDYGENSLVPGNQRMSFQILFPQLRMSCTRTDDLDIRKAESQRFHAHQNFIIARNGHGIPGRGTVFSEIFHSLTEKFP